MNGNDSMRHYLLIGIALFATVSVFCGHSRGDTGESGMDSVQMQVTATETASGQEHYPDSGR